MNILKFRIVKSASKTIDILHKRSHSFSIQRSLGSLWNDSICGEKTNIDEMLKELKSTHPQQLEKEECKPCSFNVKNEFNKLESIGCCGERGNVFNSFEQQQFAIDTIIQDHILHVTTDHILSINGAQLVQPSPVSIMDAHCHLQLDPLYSHFHQYIQNALKCDVTHMSICGTCPGQDWERVEEIYRAYPQTVVPSFGLHPWWIKQHLESVALLIRPEETKKGLTTTEYLDNATSGDKQDNTINYLDSFESQLEYFLQRIPSAGVGECGLDKGLKRDVDWDTQERVLKVHLRLAEKYSRPITLHCVGAWGRLLDVLVSHFSPSRRNTSSSSSSSTSSEKQDGVAGLSAIILHSCNSLPHEMIPRFNQLPVDVFYSLSGGGSVSKSQSLAAVIPLSQLLIETDSPDQLHTTLKDKGVTHNQPCLVRVNCNSIADSLGMDRTRLAEEVTRNAKRAYGVVV